MSQIPLQYSIEADDVLESKLATKGLRVVEVFSEWAGPCKSVLPTIKRLRMEKDDESALTFLTVKAEKCDLLDSAKEHRGKSEPLFLLFRNGQLKAKIEGANTPMLNTQILTWTPPNAEMDDLEENPIYQAVQDRERGGAPKTKGGKARK